MYRMKRARSLWPCCPICQSRVSAICLSPVSSVPVAGDSQPGPGAAPHSTPEILTSFFHPPPSSMYHPPLTIPFAFYIYFLLSVFSVCAILWGWDRGEGAGHVEITSVYVPRPASLAPAPLPPCPVCDSSHHLPYPLPYPFVPNPTPSLPHGAPSLCVVSCVCKGPRCTPLVFRASKRPIRPPCPFLGGLFPQLNQ